MKMQLLLLAVLSLLSIAGCDKPQMCPPGVYNRFYAQSKVSYKSESDEIHFWLLADRLPRDLSIRNITVPLGVKLTIVDPQWVKGWSAIIVGVNHASKMQQGQTASFEIWQGQEKKQSVKISFEKPDKVLVTTD